MCEFNISTKIFFGKGALDNLAQLTNKNIMIICDSFIGSSEILKKVKEKLTNCNVVIFDKVIPDPTIKIISLGVQFLEKEKADIIIGLGGGSSIDAAKAIKEYYLKFNSNEIKDIDFYAIPTTSGTGSEVTEYSVITNEEENLKYALAKESLLPTVAILDAELVKTVPKHITADTGMDVITHAIEAYVSESANDFTDALVEKSIYLAFDNIVKVYENGNDEEAREKMHHASCLAGIAFNSVGLGLNHGLAHTIGAKLHLSHGRTNAIILPHVIRYNLDLENSSYLSTSSNIAKRYQKLAKTLDLNSNNTLIAVNNLINQIVKIQKKLSIPSTLRELRIDLSVIDKEKDDILEAIKKDICTKNNPKKPTDAELLQLINKIIG